MEIEKRLLQEKIDQERKKLNFDQRIQEIRKKNKSDAIKKRQEQDEIQYKIETLEAERLKLDEEKRKDIANSTFELYIEQFVEITPIRILKKLTFLFLCMLFITVLLLSATIMDTTKFCFLICLINLLFQPILSFIFKKYSIKKLGHLFGSRPHLLSYVIIPGACILIANIQIIVLSGLILQLTIPFLRCIMIAILLSFLCRYPQYYSSIFDYSSSTKGINSSLSQLHNNKLATLQKKI